MLDELNNAQIRINTFMNNAKSLANRLKRALSLLGSLGKFPTAVEMYSTETRAQNVGVQLLLKS